MVQMLEMVRFVRIVPLVLMVHIVSNWPFVRRENVVYWFS
jgi:hypothetical protein